MTSIILRHLAGSRINQADQFNLDDASELTLGRDPSCLIAFDPNKDDVVSRRHAVVRVIKAEKLGFTLEDLNSANGTFLDGQKVTAEIELLPGQTIELGTGGPKLIFDVEPRPAHLGARTRMIKQPVGHQTRLTDAASLGAPKEAAFTATTVSQSAAVKQGVGRETVQRMLGEERKALSKKWMYVLAGVLVIVAGGGTALYVNTSKTNKDMQRTAAATASKIETETAALGQRVQNVQKTTPQQISDTYGESVVIVYNIWRVYDRASGRQVFHKLMRNNTNELLPAYVEMADQDGKAQIVRWLTTDGNPGIDNPISKDTQASGFVVQESGFILTNKHIASGWQVPYSTQPYETKGVLFERTNKDTPVRPKKDIDPTQVSELSAWVPDDGAWLFQGSNPRPFYKNKVPLEGRNETLDVNFKGDPNPARARLIRSAPDADVSLIKVEVVRPLRPVTMASAYEPRPGEPVVVLGYPKIAPPTVQVRRGVEGGVPREKVDTVKELTVTAGYISSIGGGVAQKENVTRIGTAGDVYMLSGITASAGSSGGPVFNGNGDVIAIHTYKGSSDSQEQTAFAVPIKYGHQIF